MERMSIVYIININNNIWEPKKYVIDLLNI